MADDGYCTCQPDRTVGGCPTHDDFLNGRKTCVVVTGRNPLGSIADDTDVFRCDKPATGERGKFPMCDEHMAMFDPKLR